MKKFESINSLNIILKAELDKVKGSGHPGPPGETEFFTDECTGSGNNLDSCKDADESY